MPRYKDTKNSQFLRTSDEEGNRSNPYPVGASNRGLDPLGDNHGRLITRIALDNGFVTVLNPFPVSLNSPPRLTYQSNLFIPEEGLLVFNEPKIIYSISGFNEGSLDGFIHVYDLDTLPVDTVSIPILSFPLSSGPIILPEQLLNELIYPNPLINGLSLAFSENPFLYETPAVGTFFSVQVSYSDI